MSKSIFNERKLINIEKVLKICSTYEYISFDVFDTLIKRNLYSPSNIFNVLNDYSQKFDIKNIKELRKSAEAKLRNEAKFVTIDDIYNEMSKKIGIEKANAVKKKEIEIEISYCQPNYEIVELLNRLKNSGKKIIAISDMYLTEEIIKKILLKNNILIDEIYVSCECKAKKRDGSLFKYVLEKNKIDKKNIIHIGDSYKADFFGSKIVGIKCIHIKRRLNYFNDRRIKKSIINKNNYETFSSIISNNVCQQQSYYEKFGLSIIGPLIYNYCIWLRKKCLEKNIHKIFFFARDGFVIKKVFDQLYKKEFDTHYIYLSRRSIRIPYAAIHSSFDEIMKFIPKTNLLTVKVFLENLGVNPFEHIDLLKKYKLAIDDVINYKEIFKEKQYRDIFNELYDEIIEGAKKELNILKQYLEQEEFNGKIAIVDIGWHNSIQFYLEDIGTHENMDLELYGFYLGIQPNEKKVKFAESFILENNEDHYVKSVTSFIGLMESVFLANEGSTKKYKVENNKVSPVLLTYEYSKNDVEYNAFEDIKKGVYSFVNIVEKLDNFEMFHLDGYDAFTALRVFGTNPYLSDVSYFSKFRFYSEEIVYFSNPRKIGYYLVHHKELKRDFFYARWKIGFMKELFKIDLPYYSVYKYYKNKKGL